MKETNWWKGEEIKFHKSAVTSVDFDPSGFFVISGSTDLRIGIHSSFCKEIDDTKREITTGFPTELNKVRLYNLFNINKHY